MMAEEQPLVETMPLSTQSHVHDCPACHLQSGWVLTDYSSLLVHKIGSLAKLACLSHFSNGCQTPCPLYLGNDQ